MAKSSKKKPAARREPHKRRTDALTPAQEKFCQAYALDPNGAKAYGEAYPASRKWTAKTRTEKASRLLATGNIQARVSALRQRVQEKAEHEFEITVNRILAEYARLAFADIRDVITWGDSVAVKDTETGEVTLVNSVVIKASKDIPARAAAALASIEQTKEGGLKVRFHNKTPALDSLSKHFGLFKELHEHTGKDGGPIQVTELSDFERARRLAFLLQAGLQQQDAGASPADDQPRPQLTPDGGFRRPPPN